MTQEINQFLFDKAVSGVLKQGGPSFVSWASNKHLCVYRNPDNGRKCAAGHIIPDEEYDPAMERTTISGLSRILGHLEWNWDLVASLQYSHDTSVWNEEGILLPEDQFMELFKNKCRSLANEYHLSKAVLGDPT